MDRAKRDLEALVSSQKEQLLRYEKRLKDVVTAYKGLLKEKEALETSLAAITANKDGQNDKDVTDINNQANSEAGNETTVAVKAPGDHSRRSSSTSLTESRSDLQTQIMTLMNSLATLSAEKSRMEASFQGDKKQLRLLLDEKDKRIAEYQQKLNEAEDHAKVSVDEIKAKWIIERQEREKETNNQMVMIRELQKLYADERHLKENIEMQLNNFKTQFVSNEAENSRVRELQTQLKEAKSQLKKLQASNANRTADNDQLADSATIIKQVQQEMQELKNQHAIAIKSEQRRAHLAEEQSRQQAALHEDRVANLEARLAELSSTVGTYDRLRQQDQENIQSLRHKLQQLDRSATDGDTGGGGRESETRRKPNAHDVAGIVEEIARLKKLLMNENARAESPIDLSSIFVVGSDHLQCQEELKHVQEQCEAAKQQVEKLQEKVHVQKSHIHTLQEKVKVLNRNIDEQELELKQQSEKLRQAIKDERNKWKDAIAELENDYRCKLNEMEQQLQKQRERSLHLLDEKEQEIKTLQTSFDVFQTATLPVALATKISTDAHESQAMSSDGESIDVAPQAASTRLKSKKLSVGDSCHMLHYANEIARKDIEIAGLRKAKYAAETALRRAIQEKVNAQEDLCDKIALLEEQVDRLERCKTREGANLEYLKNVIISYIVTKDPDGKRHMLNAISAVLQFTPAETQSINSAFQKK